MAIPNPNARPKLKTSFKKARCIAPLHTSGPVTVTSDGRRLITCVEDEAILTDVESGTEICRFSGDTQPIYSLCISPSAQRLILFTASLSLRIYDLSSAFNGGKLVHPIRVVGRAHDAPVHVCLVDPTSTYLASGSADGIVKVWDIFRGHVTHVFKGHGGIVSALKFNFPRDPASASQDRKMQLITASVDTRIRLFNLSASSSKNSGILGPDAVLEGHSSVPRGLDVSQDGKWLLSGGRDSVVLIWDLSHSYETKGIGAKQKLPTLVKTVPILERVEAMGLIQLDDDVHGSRRPSDNIYFFTGGQSGIVKIWDGREGNVLFTLGGQHGDVSDDQEEQQQIVNAIYVQSTSTIATVHADQNILFHSLKSGALTRQIIGYNDEIVDAVFLSPFSATSGDLSKTDTHVALATNSSLIRVYSTSTLDARLLPGHKDIVLCLDRSPQGIVLASGSKDRSARLWTACSSKQGGLQWKCTAICEGHTESIGAVAMSRGAGDVGKEMHLRPLFTGSQDRTIKMWDLSFVPSALEDDDVAPVKCKSLTTLKAHDKDINSLDVAPNDRLLASGSQDRTAKVHEIEFMGESRGKPAWGALKLLGICKGHKRGVWTVKFGRTERVLATGSGDKTVKLWSLEDFSCVKTFDGHTNSVLRVDFINFGMQMVSAASDGLVKLWNVKEEECMATMDNHEDKIWALAVSADERTIVSGAADSVVTFWEDCTEEEERAKEIQRTELASREQDFLNYCALKNYRKAIELALSLEQPGRLLNLFKDIRSGLNVDPSEIESSVTGHPAVDEVISTLAASDLAKLLRYVRDWNTNVKTSEVAQGILFAILKLRSAEDVINAFGSETGELLQIEPTPDGTAGGEDTRSGSVLKELLDALIPYTERHLARMEKLLQDSYVVDYILGEMDDGMMDTELGNASENDEMMDIDLGVKG